MKKAEHLLTRKYLALKSSLDHSRQRKKEYTDTAVKSLIFSVIFFVIFGITFVTTIQFIAKGVTQDAILRAKGAATVEWRNVKDKILDNFTFHKIFAFYHKDGRLFYNLGLMYEKKGMLENAILQFQWASIMEPNNDNYKRKLRMLENRKLTPN